MPRGRGAGPIKFYGREESNWLLDRVIGNQRPSCDNPKDITWGAVRRHRYFKCQEGYTWFTSDVCYRGAAQEDIAKNYGQRCEKDQCTTGNPINAGAKNKFRAEKDYVDPTGSGLSFTRYYNSRAMTSSNGIFMRYPAYEQSVGPAAYATIVSSSGDQGTRSAVTALAGMGVGWTHTFQRSIWHESGNLLTSAYAQRHDGQVLTFTKMSGQWYAQPDVNLRLEETGSGWKLTLNDDSVETYDTTGRLRSIRSRAGRTQSVNYDGCGRLYSVTDVFGRSLVFGYPAECGSSVLQRITSVRLPDGTSYFYQYDDDGKLIHAAGRGYHYENSTFKYALTGITDESEQRYATFGYDAEGRPNLSTLAGGAERVTVSYVGGTTLTTALGASIQYAFQIVQGVPRVSTQSAYCEGCPVNAKSLTYDANGNISVWKDFKNVETRYIYDLTRNLETSRTEASGTPRARTITTQWHATFRLPTQVTESGRRTNYTHDANGNVLTKTVTDLTATPNTSRTWTYTYNSIGQVMTVDGPRTDVSDVTTYTYYNCAQAYQCGQVETITNALGQVRTYNTYNAHGQPLTITDPNNAVTTLTYDSRQRLASRTVGTEQTTFEYWPTGLLKKTTLPDGSYLEYSYDAAHRLSEINDQEGNRIHYTLDLMGNRTNEEVFDSSQALSRTRIQVFNTLSQLRRQTSALGTSVTTLEYDENGNQTGLYGPLGRNNTQNYDELQRLNGVVDPAYGLTTYGYDALDQLIAVTDPKGLTTSYTYNGLGDLKQQVSPDTGTTINTFDSGGNLKTSQDARNKTATYSYDALDRVIGVSYADQVIGYTYDQGLNGVGRLTGMFDGSGSTSWAYDALGRTTSRQQAIGSIQKSLSASYNAGRLQSTVMPSGNTVSYSYQDGKIVGLALNGSPLLSQVLYEPFGAMRGWTWGNGSLMARTHDQDGRIVQLDSAGLKTYDYDDASRIVSIDDGDNPSLNTEYAYDVMDRFAGTGGTPTIALSATTVAAGQNVTVTVNGLGDAVGYWLALTTADAPNTTYSQWIAVTSSTGSFSWTVTVPLVGRDYQVRLFRNGFQRVTASTTLTVTPPPAPTQPRLDLPVTVAAPGATVTVRFTGGPGGSSDWLDLRAVGSSSYVQWITLGSGVKSRDWTVTLPTTGTEWQFTFHGYSQTAVSAPISLSTIPPVSAVSTESITAGASTVAAGQNLAVTVNGLATGSGHWLALAPIGAPNSTYGQWTTLSPTGGSFVWNVTAPLFAGGYEVRLFRDGFQRITTSSTITVTPPSPPTSARLDLGVAYAAPNTPVTVRLSGAPGGGGDWITIAPVGASNNTYGSYTYVGSGVTTRDWTVTLPKTGTAYEIRLLLNSGYTIAARSAPITLTTTAPVAVGSGGDTYGNPYSYDANGNRLTSPGSTYIISATSNRVTSISGALTKTYAYDNAGNTTSDGTATFTYNDAGRLIAATKGGVTSTYALNGLGQRVRKTTNGVSTYFVYDEAGHLVGEYDSSGSLIAETIWFDDIPVAVLKPNGSGGVNVFYIHADHLNTPRRVTRPSDNAIVWRWDSDAFGTTAANQNPSGLGAFNYNLRFPGQYYDSETGLHYNYFRDYDPATGRYAQSDPIGVAAGVNTYGYVGGSPLMFGDPLGLEKEIWLPANDPNRPAAEKIPNNPAVCLIISHGSSSTVNRLNASQLYDKLRKICKPKQPIKLDACDTGKGENSIAEQLAKLWGAQVTAPDGKVWTTPWDTEFDTPAPPVSEDKDSFWNGVPNWAMPGSWRRFGPTGPIPPPARPIDRW